MFAVPYSLFCKRFLRLPRVLFAFMHLNDVQHREFPSPITEMSRWSFSHKLYGHCTDMRTTHYCWDVGIYFLDDICDFCCVVHLASKRV